MEAAIAGLIGRSTASGWLLCIIGLAALAKLAQLVVLQRPKMREMDISEGGILRTAIAAEMSGLRDEVAGLRKENSDLRAEVRALHAIIDGMRREALTGQLATQTAMARGLGDAVPPATRATLDRLDAMTGVGE